MRTRSRAARGKDAARIWGGRRPTPSAHIFSLAVARTRSRARAARAAHARAGIGYDYAMNGVWNMMNKGKLWKDIKDNYAEEE